MYEEKGPFICVQAGLDPGLLNPLAVTLAVVGAVISAAWLIIGDEDRYLLRDFTLDCYEASE